MANKKYLHVVRWSALGAVLMLGACAQERKGRMASSLSEVQELYCSEPSTGEWNCMRARADFTKNIVYLEMRDLGVTRTVNGQTLDVPFRLYIRTFDKDTYDIVATNVYSGSLLEVSPPAGYHVLDIVDWYLETEENFNQFKTTWIPVQDFDGVGVFDQEIVWQNVPERLKKQYETVDPFSK